MPAKRPWRGIDIHPLPRSARDLGRPFTSGPTALVRVSLGPERPTAEVAFEVVSDGRVVERVRIGPTLAWVQYETPLGSGWHVCAMFLRRQEALVLSEVKVFPGPDRSVVQEKDERESAEWQGLPFLGWVMPGLWSEDVDALEEVDGGIDSRVLRSVRLGEIQDRVESFVRQYAGVAEQVLRAEPESLSARPGRGGRRDVYYARWAARYVEAAASSPAPLVEMAKQYTDDDGHHPRPGQLRDIIHEARRRTLLTRAGKGRKGGVLTDKAIALLRDATEAVSTDPHDMGHQLAALERILASPINFDKEN